VAVLRMAVSGSFKYNTGWQFYVRYRVEVLSITQGGSFTYDTE